MYAGDHGKSKHRFGSKLVIRLKEGKNATQIYALADIACTKDTGEVFRSTVMHTLAKGVNKVEDGRVQFTQDEESKKWTATIVMNNETTDDPLICDVTEFMIGDLKFLSMMLGKENFDSIWCILCQLRNVDWQKKGHKLGELWTLKTLIQQAKDVLEKGLEGIERKGVREQPYFKVPVERYVWPLLHMLIGIGNAILEFFMNVVDNDIQSLSPKEIRTKQDVRELNREIEELMAQKIAWNSKSEDSVNGQLRELRKLRNSLEKRFRSMSHCLNRLRRQMCSREN